jgi:hypothetical protein
MMRGSKSMRKTLLNIRTGAVKEINNDNVYCDFFHWHSSMFAGVSNLYIAITKPETKSH